MFKKQNNNATFLIGQEMSAPKHLPSLSLGEVNIEVIENFLVNETMRRSQLLLD